MSLFRKPHWERKTHLFKADEYICSECGLASPKPYKVCPNCGMKARNVKSDLTWVDEAEMLDIILEDD